MNWWWPLLSIKLVAVLLVVVFLFGQFVGEHSRPLDNAVSPAARFIGITSGHCPSGWDDISLRDQDFVVFACEREIDGTIWHVNLHTFDDPAGEFKKGDFAHAFPVDTEGAEFLYEESQVPQWPAR